MQTLIVTPLAEEQHLLVQSLRKRGAEAEGQATGPIQAHAIPSLDLLIAHGGHGKAQFAVQTRYLLDTHSAVGRVVCVGAAGGIANGVQIGDVIVSIVTHEHDYLNRFVERPQPRFPGDPEIIERLRALKPSSAYQLHFGVVASGDEDVVERTRGDELHQRTGALAVAWEGAGGARACALTGTPFVEIRCVTDSADHDAPSDFETNLALAMDNAADLIVCWLGS